VGVLSRSVSESPSRPSVLFHMAYLMVPFYLQPYIIYLLLMPARPMGVSLRHSQMTLPYLCPIQNRWAPIATQLIDGLLPKMEDKSERFENAGHLFH
jgi:hypothetical protein